MGDYLGPRPPSPRGRTAPPQAFCCGLVWPAPSMGSGMSHWVLRRPFPTRVFRLFFPLHKGQPSRTAPAPGGGGGGNRRRFRANCWGLTANRRRFVSWCRCTANRRDSTPGGCRCLANRRRWCAGRCLRLVDRRFVNASPGHTTRLRRIRPPHHDRVQPSCGTKLEPNSRDAVWRCVAHHRQPPHFMVRKDWLVSPPSNSHSYAPIPG